MMKPRIFISYRREETFGMARALCDRLIQHFGEGSVFMDVDGIELGDDFAEVIERTLESCKVMIALIGKRWLVAEDKNGRRLSHPEDFVRLEIAAALTRRIRVIPVLAQGASMPSATDLPAELAPLARRNATIISEIHFKSDVHDLIRALEKALNKKDTPDSEPEAEKGGGHAIASTEFKPTEFDFSPQLETLLRARALPVESKRSPFRERWELFWFYHQDHVGWSLIMLTALVAPFLPPSESLLPQPSRWIIAGPEIGTFTWHLFALVLVPLSALAAKIGNLVDRWIIRPYRPIQYAALFVFDFALFMVTFIGAFGADMGFPGLSYAVACSLGALILSA